MATTPVSRVCIQCGKEFYSGVKKKVFCSRRCGGAYAKKKYRLHNPKVYLSTATVGALAELAVSSDLLKKGWSVFRALSASCPCDLAILGNAKLLLVEVRTGYRTNTNQLSWPKKCSGQHDIWAIYEKTGLITYIPELPEQT